MKIITEDQLKELCRNGTPIDMQGGYPCVVLHPDDTITKIWAIKKGFFSSATLNPYSRRFVNNATRLAKRGLVVPEVLNHARVKGSHIKIVTYRSLPGSSIRDLLKDAPREVDIPSLCAYILDLHEKGILFRSIHLGNIILLPDGTYGLIDFTDVKYFNQPVSLDRRAANLAFPLRYPEDVDRMNAAGLPSMPESYLDLLKPDTQQKERFMKVLNQYSKR